MKNKLFLIMLMSMFAVATIMTACKKEDKEKEPDKEQERPDNDLTTGQIEYKITDIQSDFTISIGALAKKITIDWGDGCDKYEYTPTSLTDTAKITHAYSTKTGKIIKISAEGITGFFVDGDGYTGELGEDEYIYTPKYQGEISFDSCAKLQLLYLANIPGTSVDIKKLDALKWLTITNMRKVTQLDVSKSVNLVILYLLETPLTFLDVSNNLHLEQLMIIGGRLTNLDVKYNSALKRLGCEGGELQSLDVSHNTALEYLYTERTQQQSLDVSHNTKLRQLLWYSGKLQNLDVSHNPALTELCCPFNQLQSLDLSHNAALTKLICSFNQLQNLDVSHNTALTDLRCHNNQLQILDISQNMALTVLRCDDNQLSTDALNALFTSLPTREPSDNASISIGGNPGTISCYKSIATDKGWEAYYN